MGVVLEAEIDPLDVYSTSPAGVPYNFGANLVAQFSTIDVFVATGEVCVHTRPVHIVHKSDQASDVTFANVDLTKINVRCQCFIQVRIAICKAKLGCLRFKLALSRFASQFAKQNWAVCDSSWLYSDPTCSFRVYLYRRACYVINAHMYCVLPLQMCAIVSTRPVQTTSPLTSNLHRPLIYHLPSHLK